MAHLDKNIIKEVKTVIPLNLQVNSGVELSQH